MSEQSPPRSFRRRGLGRGLDALLTNEAEAEEGSPLISLRKFSRVMRIKQLSIIVKPDTRIMR